MQKARLDDSQAGIKNARRDNNNLRYGGDTTLIEESLLSPLGKVKVLVAQLCPSLL